MPESGISLNAGQIEVLRWIADGSPPDVMEGYTHRISSAALRTRGLVRISGHGETWRAELTERGHEQLKWLDSGWQTPPASPEPETADLPPRAPRLEPPATEDPGPQRLTKTEQLVADVLAAGGQLSLPDDTARGGTNWRQRAYAAQRHGKVPPGKHLAVSWTNAGFKIELLDGETGNELGADAVPVPARLNKYHPIAVEFRNRTALHEVSRQALPRVLRIVHALAKEAERRGHRIACVSMREDFYGRSEWKPSQDGQLTFSIGGHDLKVRLWEKGAGLRGPYDRQMKRWQDDRGKPFREMQFLDRPKPYDSNATGELNIEVLGWANGRQARWGDRQRWTVEDRLPQLMRELEAQAAEAEERRLAKEREEAERQRRWEDAMAQAKVRLVEAHRLDVLRARVAAWNEADAIRAYCDAIEARHGAETVAANLDAGRWLAFARDYADSAQELPTMPADPEVTPERLKPHLSGLSPYGPRGW